LLGDSDVARAEKRHLTETEAGIAKACSPKIQWPGGHPTRIGSEFLPQCLRQGINDPAKMRWRSGFQTLRSSPGS